MIGICALLSKKDCSAWQHRFIDKSKIYLVYLFFLPFLLMRKRIKKSTVKKILVIRLDRFGDMVLSFPYIVALRKKYPTAIIKILCSPAGAGFLRSQNNAYHEKLIDEIIVWNDVWDMHRGLALGFKHFMCLIENVISFRTRKYDVVVQPVQVGIWTLLALLLRCNCVVATIDHSLPLSRLLGRFVDMPVNIYNAQKNHVTDQLGRCVEKIGVLEINKNVLLLDDRSVSSPIKQISLQSAIIINISAGDSVRQLPVDVMISLMERLNSAYCELDMILTGVAEDKYYAEQLCTKLQFSITNTVGDTTVDDLIYFFKKALVLLTPDTGTMHLAAMTDIHIVAYFTAGSLSRFAPVTDNCTIIQHELGCSGCGDMCFTDEMPKPCMAAITADELFLAVDNVLSGVDVE